MNDKEVVLALESRAPATQIEDGTWLVRRSPFGVILGHGSKQARAWHKARMRLFVESVGSALANIPAVEK